MRISCFFFFVVVVVPFVAFKAILASNPDYSSPLGCSPPVSLVSSDLLILQVWTVATGRQHSPHTTLDLPSLTKGNVTPTHSFKYVHLKRNCTLTQCAPRPPPPQADIYTLLPI